jgi:hypothetical protein
MDATPLMILPRSEACAEDLQALGYRFAGLDGDPGGPFKPERPSRRVGADWGWTLAGAMLAGLTLALALPAPLAGI